MVTVQLPLNNHHPEEMVAQAKEEAATAVTADHPEETTIVEATKEEVMKEEVMIEKAEKEKNGTKIPLLVVRLESHPIIALKKNLIAALQENQVVVLQENLLTIALRKIQIKASIKEIQIIPAEPEDQAKKGGSALDLFLFLCFIIYNPVMALELCRVF